LVPFGPGVRRHNLRSVHHPQPPQTDALGLPIAPVQKEETLDEQEEKLRFALRERDQWMRQCLEAEAKAERFNEELLKVDYVLFGRLKYGPNNGTRAEIMSDLADAIEANAMSILRTLPKADHDL
jgi:hypothetical protein